MKLQKKIDSEIKKIVDNGYGRAKRILTEKLNDLHKIAKALLQYETLTGDEIRDIIFKNIYPKRLTLEEELAPRKVGSALGVMGLKPKTT